MKHINKKYLAVFILLPVVLIAQNIQYDFSFSANINYTTSSRLYLQPNSSDEIARNQYENLEDIYNYSAELRYQFLESVFIGLGTEFFKKTYSSSLNLGGVRAPMKDGYQFIPIELSFYYYLPFSTERFKFFMGGGGGIYFAKYIRELADVSISSEQKKISAGIHVVVGLEYIIKDFISVRGQMRFRNPEFELTNTYSNQRVNYNGRTFCIQSPSFSTKVDVDGITFSLGAVLSF